MTSALKSAKTDDTPVLGSSDDLLAKNLSFGSDATIKTAAGAHVSFSRVDVVNVANVKFDEIHCPVKATGGNTGGADDSDEGGNGHSDTFRFDGSKTGSCKVSGLDFSEGDQIRLVHFQHDTFDHLPGGNNLRVAADGSFAVIDSLIDLQELDTLSSKVKVRDLGDSGIEITINQLGHAKLVITLDHMAQDYNPYYDNHLF